MFYPGVRIENIAFPLTISAVQGAICSCLGNGDQPEVLFQKKPYSELQDWWTHEFSLQVKHTLPDSVDLYSPLIEVSDLHESLNELSTKTMTPNSDFPVAALLQVKEGYVAGVNVEVSAWSLGLCAERVAISRAVSAGYNEFESLHIYAPKGDFSSPCGACRQVLAEWLPDKQIELHHGDGTCSRHYTSHLLPYAFTTESLKK